MIVCNIASRLGDVTLRLALDGSGRPVADEEIRTMKTTKLTKGAGVCLAAMSMAALLADATMASAQPDQGYNNKGG